MKVPLSQLAEKNKKIANLEDARENSSYLKELLEGHCRISQMNKYRSKTLKRGL